VESIELREEGIGILLDMGIIFPQNLSQKFVLRVVNGLDDVFVVPREIEKASTLPRRSEF
jgi:hypothetical protein